MGIQVPSLPWTSRGTSWNRTSAVLSCLNEVMGVVSIDATHVAKVAGWFLQGRKTSVRPESCADRTTTNAKCGLVVWCCELILRISRAALKKIESLDGNQRSISILDTCFIQSWGLIIYDFLYYRHIIGIILYYRHHRI